MCTFIQNGKYSEQIGNQDNYYYDNIQPDLVVKYFNNFYQHLFLLSISLILSVILLYLINSIAFLTSICFMFIYHSYYISKNMNFIYIYTDEELFVKGGIRYFLKKTNNIYVVDIENFKFTNKIKIIKNNGTEEIVVFTTQADKNNFLENINIPEYN